MAKLDKILEDYAKTAKLVVEELPPAIPPIEDPAAALPGAAPAPAVPAPAPSPAAGEESETKTLTDQGYVVAVQDMLELLSINPKDIEESDLDIFSDRVNPKNAFDIHEKLQDLINRYGSPTT